MLCLTESMMMATGETGIIAMVAINDGIVMNMTRGAAENAAVTMGIAE